MTKYELFKKLTNELTPLVINLEKDIAKLMSNSVKAQPNTQTASSFGKRFKSLVRPIFASESSENLIFLYKNRKYNLRNYIKLENKINEIYNNFINENYIISENTSEISGILSNFREKFINVIKNIATELQSDYEAEKNEIMKKVGSPDDISDEDIESAHATRSASVIDNTIEEFSKLDDYDEDLTKLTKYSALLRIYFANPDEYPDEFEELPPLLKKIINEGKYETAKSLLPPQLREKLEAYIQEGMSKYEN